MSRHRRRAPLVALIFVVAAAASCAGPADVRIPVGFADEVAAARRSLESNWDGPMPASFSFFERRCRADGGLLLLFRQHGFGADGLAVAMQGPGALPESWAGGFAPIDPATDPEIEHFFSEASEVACP